MTLAVVVKTFMREECCERACASVRERLPDAHLIVIDDSAKPHNYDCDTYIPLPFDSGLSAGRNAGVIAAKAVGAEYVLLMDDDLELTSGVEMALARLGEYDIVCGAFIQDGDICHYEHTFAFDDTVCPPTLTLRAATVGRIDCGHNLLLTRASTFERVLWDAQFKIEAEHLDFFLSARKAGLSVCYEPDLRAIHHHKEKSGIYHDYRFRKDSYPVLVRKWGLARIYDTEGRVHEA